MTLSAADRRGMEALIGQNDGLRQVLEEVARRQPNSITMQRAAAEAVAGLPSQLPYAAPMLVPCIASAAGAMLTDVDGNRYLDCHMGYTASIMGHNPPAVEAAVREALPRGLGAGHFLAEQVALAETIKRLVPTLDAVCYAHSGGEAIAAAVRIARAATGRRKVAKFEGCYHGWPEIGVYNTMMILSGRLPTEPVTGIAPRPATAGVDAAAAGDIVILPYNCPEAMEIIRRLGSELACVVVDPAPPFMADHLPEAQAFLTQLREVTAATGALLILDEVVSGFRLARGGAQDAFGLQADMACYGKITAGLGIPLSAIGGSAEIMRMASSDGLFADYPAKKAWVSSTHAGNGLAVIAALAQMEALERSYDEIAARLDRNHARLREAVGAIAERQGIQVWLSGHSRLQSSIVLGPRPEGPATYRDTMRAMSPWAFRPMLALSFYLRLRGIFTKTVPTMNLSAAHSEEDVHHIASALEESLVEMRAHGLLHGLEGP